MRLDSAEFVLFLSVVWTLWRVVPVRFSFGPLLLANLFFCAFSGPVWLIVLAALLAANRFALCGLARFVGSKRDLVFWAAVSFNIGVLIFFKWAGVWLRIPVVFSSPFLSGLVSPGGTVGFPLGLSFITFQMVACLTDVYRGQYRWTSSTLSFFVFGSFFPQVSSGPIPRAGELMPELIAARRPSGEDLARSLSLMLVGAFKKFVIANRLQIYVHEVYNSDLPFSSATVALGIFFGAVQLYADFSGYTDMARGTAGLFGINLPENFDRPYLAESVTDFWRRWHMSLSRWLRDYLYMPLVVRLRGLGMAGIAISSIVTFVICGIWHRVTWCFVIYGVLHGSAIALELVSRKMRKRAFESVPSGALTALGRIYAAGFFALTTVLFYSPDLSRALSLYKKLLEFSLPANVAEFFAYNGPLLFLLNLAALGLWFVADRATRRREIIFSPGFVTACVLAIVFLGKLPEGNFIYVQF